MNNIATHFNNNQVVCSCPHCNSSSLTRSGFDRGTQRYRCKNCNKTFKATAGTPVHGLHKKEKIAKYLEAMHKGLSVRKAAKYAGISPNTSFDWRHKFLSSLQTGTIVQPNSQTSSAEIIQLEYSAKGRRKPPEKNTFPTKTIAIFRDRQLELHKLEQLRHTRHAAKLFSECPARFFAISAHRTLTVSIKRSENAFNIKNRQLSASLIANAKRQTAKLLSWMERFRGVASKYLQNYWNWYSSLLNLRELKREAEHFCRLCTDGRSLDRYFIVKKL